MFSLLIINWLLTPALSFSELKENFGDCTCIFFLFKFISVRWTKQLQWSSSLSVQADFRLLANKESQLAAAFCCYLAVDFHCYQQRKLKPTFSWFTYSIAARSRKCHPTLTNVSLLLRWAWTIFYLYLGTYIHKCRCKCYSESCTHLLLHGWGS